MKCLRCNHKLTISHDIDWHNCYIYYYPVCTNCGWTTRQVFDSEGELKDWYAEIEKEKTKT